MALQAEHDDAAARAAATLLALWQGGVLRTVAGPAAAGYAGDIASRGEHLLLSAPRAGLVLQWSAATGWASTPIADQPCALAASPGRTDRVDRTHRVWCGSAAGLWAIDGPDPLQASAAQARPLRLDNHAVLV